MLGSQGDEMSPNNGQVRFFRGNILLGSAPLDTELTLCEHAEMAEVDIPTNCTSGTCGTCMVTLLSGEVPLPKEIPPGLAVGVSASAWLSLRRPLRPLPLRRFLLPRIG